MKLAKKYFGIAALVIGAATLLAGSSVYAAGPFTASGNNARLDAKDTVDSSAYMAGENVTVEGTIKGDLFCAGQKVTVKGTVEGDVLCAGSDLTIAGTVKGDVRAAGARVWLQGTIDGSATLAGSEVTVEKTASIRRDLTAGSSKLVLGGTVGRDVVVGAADTTFTGVIGRTVLGSFENNSATFDSSAQIGGDLNYQSTKEVTVPQGVVAGSVNFTKAAQDSGMSAGEKIFGALIAFFGFMLLCLAVVLVMPKFVHESAVVSWKTMLLQFLAGFAFICLVPLASIMLLISGVGTFVGLALTATWFLTLTVSGAMFAYYVGYVVFGKRADNAVAIMLGGAIILGALLLIPIINVLTVIAMVVCGTGMVLFSIRSQFSKHPYKIVTES